MTIAKNGNKRIICKSTDSLFFGGQVYVIQTKKRWLFITWWSFQSDYYTLEEAALNF